MALNVPDYIQALNPYVPGKPIEETQRELGLRRVVKLASNENPLGPSPKALAAIRKAASELHRYPDSNAFRLKKALSAHLDVAPEQLLIGNGSNDVIDLLIRTYCQPGDAIATSKAAFVAYRICAQIHGVETLEAPMTDELRFDLNAIAAMARDFERTRMIFIANPNNPTGTWVTAPALREFLDRVRGIRDGSVLVVLDYAYWEYVTDPSIPDPTELMREYPNVVVLRTFSKAYGLAGMRCGYGVGQPRIMSMMEKVRQPFNGNSLALAGAEAALKDQAFVRKSKKLNEQGLRYWQAQLGRMGIPYWLSQGNFILADVGTGLGRDGASVYQACLRRGVIFRPVANYGIPGAIRISVGTPEENEKGARALAQELPKEQAARLRNLEARDRVLRAGRRRK